MSAQEYYATFIIKKGLYPSFYIRKLNIFNKLPKISYKNCIEILVGDDKSELEDIAKQITREIFLNESDENKHD